MDFILGFYFTGGEFFWSWRHSFRKKSPSTDGESSCRWILFLDIILHMESSSGVGEILLGWKVPLQKDIIPAPGFYFWILFYRWRVLLELEIFF